MSQSDLPEVEVISTLERLQLASVDAVEETSESNSQPIPIDTHSVDPSQSVNLHPRIVEALSEVPYSPLFGILWPIIVEQASFETRDVLRDLSIFFHCLCHPHKRSDRAKRSYVSVYGNREKQKGLPFVLDLSFGVEWRCWGAYKCGFHSVEAFRVFCALGDIDPDQGRSWERCPESGNLPPLKYIWMSRTKDIVLETSQDPLTQRGSCYHIGLTGVADKAIAMFNFMHDNYSSSYADSMATDWVEMMWYRNF